MTAEKWLHKFSDLKKHVPWGPSQTESAVGKIHAWILERKKIRREGKKRVIKRSQKGRQEARNLDKGNNGNQNSVLNLFPLPLTIE